MFHVRDIIKVFSGRAPNCDIFYSTSVGLCFSGRISLKHIEEKRLYGVRGHALPEKNLKFYVM